MKSVAFINLEVAEADNRLGQLATPHIQEMGAVRDSNTFRGKRISELETVSKMTRPDRYQRASLVLNCWQSFFFLILGFDCQRCIKFEL